MSKSHIIIAALLLAAPGCSLGEPGAQPDSGPGHTQSTTTTRTLPNGDRETITSSSSVTRTRFGTATHSYKRRTLESTVRTSVRVAPSSGGPPSTQR